MPHRLRVIARRVAVAFLGLTSLALVASLPARAQSPEPSDQTDTTVEILPLKGFLDPPTVGAISDLIRDAAEAGSSLVVVQLNSPGAVSADLRTLIDEVRSSSVPVAVFVGPQAARARAAGGAALLLGAAHIRAVAADASVGPALPLDLARGGAERDDAAVLEASWADLPGEVGGRLQSEAIPGADLADHVTLVVPGLETLLVELDGRTVETATGPVTLRMRPDEVNVRFHSLGVVRRLLHAATTAPFIYLLLVAGIGMLLFELFQPGFGVAGVAGLATAAVGIFGLTVLPVTWWGVALTVLGLVLFAVDTAIAGFGPVTAAAAGSFAVGSLNFYASEPLGLSGWLVAATTATAFLFFVLVMTSLLRAQAGPGGEAAGNLVGSVGVVRSVLNPEGHVFIDGALWRARWTGDGRRARVGTLVQVHGVDGPLLMVSPADVGGPAGAELPSDASSS